MVYRIRGRAGFWKITDLSTDGYNYISVYQKFQLIQWYQWRIRLRIALECELKFMMYFHMVLHHSSCCPNSQKSLVQKTLIISSYPSYQQFCWRCWAGSHQQVAPWHAGPPSGRTASAWSERKSPHLGQLAHAWVGVAQHLHLHLRLQEESSSGPPNVTPTNEHLGHIPCETSHFMSRLNNMEKCQILSSHSDELEVSDLLLCYRVLRG